MCLFVHMRDSFNSVMRQTYLTCTCILEVKHFTDVSVIRDTCTAEEILHRHICTCTVLLYSKWPFGSESLNWRTIQFHSLKLNVRVLKYFSEAVRILLQFRKYIPLRGFGQLILTSLTWFWTCFKSWQVCGTFQITLKSSTKRFLTSSDAFGTLLLILGHVSISDVFLTAYFRMHPNST